MFAITSVGCAIADSRPELLAYRMLQAAGDAAGSSVVVNALLRDLSEKDTFSRAMSFVILVMTLAPLVAPVVGGYISTHASWRVIFWLLVGISLLICLVIQWKIEETLKSEHRQPLKIGQILKNYWDVLSHCGAMGYVLCCSLSSSGMFKRLTLRLYRVFQGADRALRLAIYVTSCQNRTVSGYTPLCFARHPDRFGCCRPPDSRPDSGC